VSTADVLATLPATWREVTMKRRPRRLRSTKPPGYDRMLFFVGLIELALDLYNTASGR